MASLTPKSDFTWASVVSPEGQVPLPPPSLPPHFLCTRLLPPLTIVPFPLAAVFGGGSRHELLAFNMDSSPQRSGILVVPHPSALSLRHVFSRKWLALRPVPTSWLPMLTL